MHSFYKRARLARLALGLVALALPFVAVSGAQAAIGLSTPVTTTGPDLRSATIAPGNAVNVCFDQTIDLNGAGLGQTAVGGYKSNAGAGSGAPVIISDSCVQVQFPGSVDLPSATVFSVNAGIVKAQLNNQANLTDSTPLIGSTSQNGTRGNTTGPDLTTAIVDGPNNQINYVFDQDVNCTVAANTNWRFYGSDGVEHPSTLVLGCSGNIVRVSFAASPAVTIAQRVSVGDAQVTSMGPSSTVNRIASAIVPGNTGTSAAPDLVSNELVSPTGNQISFTFDENIQNVNPNAFVAVYSDGTPVNGTGQNVINGNTAVISFPSPAAESQTEYLVRAYVNTAGVQSQDNGQNAPQNGLPAGGNAGAFAQGYTTGPDALSASVNQSLGQVTVKMDQRMGSVINGTAARLVNPDGTLGSSTSATTAATSSAPGPADVTFNFAQSDLANAVGIFLPGPIYSAPNPVVGTLNGYPNVQQILSIR